MPVVLQAREATVHERRTLMMSLLEQHKGDLMVLAGVLVFVALVALAGGG